MLLETNTKTSTFGKKPHIKKGYYPGKLLKVELFADKNGNPKIGMYGQQLIFDFEVWKADENEVPVEPLKDDDGNIVILSKFVYHKYKSKDEDGNYAEGEYHTAITRNSKGITKLLEALGWKFSEEAVDPEKFIGTFVELNIKDYQQGKGDEAYTASTVDSVDSIDLSESAEDKEITPEVQSQIDKLEESKKNLDNLKASDGLTEQGYTDAMEQVEHDIKKLKA